MEKTKWKNNKDYPVEKIEIQKNKKVKIGYKEYEIVKKPEIIDLPNECYGKIDYDKENRTLVIEDNEENREKLKYLGNSLQPWRKFAPVPRI